MRTPPVDFRASRSTLTREEAIERGWFGPVDARVLDCGTPQRYLAANLAVSGGLTSREGSAPGACLPLAEVTRSVLWSGAEVLDGEVLDGAIRTTAGRTVLVRPVPTVPTHNV